MITIVGDEELDVIELPNGMTIKMDFATDKTGIWGWRGRITGKWRRIKLYDKNEQLISETIEENPLFNPDVKMNIPYHEGILY